MLQSVLQSVQVEVNEILTTKTVFSIRYSVMSGTLFFSDTSFSDMKRDIERLLRDTAAA